MAKRRIWSPDETDVKIVTALLDLSGPHGALVIRGELAEQLKLPVPALGRRLRWLCQVGYLRRERSAPKGYARYIVVKTASEDDRHDLGLYYKAKSFSFDAKRAAEAVQRYRDGATIKELMEHYGASYATVRGVLEEAGVEIRRGGRART